MADVVVCNRARLAHVWPLFLHRVRAMAAAPSSAARTAALHALRRAALALLAAPRAGHAPATAPGTDSAAHGDAQPASAGATEGVAAEAGVSTEERVMQALAEVYRQRGAAHDVQQAALDLLHSILQARSLAAVGSFVSRTLCLRLLSWGLWVPVRLQS